MCCDTAFNVLIILQYFLTLHVTVQAYAAGDETALTPADKRKLWQRLDTAMKAITLIHATHMDIDYHYFIIININCIICVVTNYCNYIWCMVGSRS